MVMIERIRRVTLYSIGSVAKDPLKKCKHRGWGTVWTGRQWSETNEELMKQ